MKREIKKVLKATFGYTKFRGNQENIILNILDKKDVFTSMPTGGGKSLCYQIPGIIFEGLTVVISPLIALMKDQVDEAVAKGIPAAFLNSTLAADEISGIYGKLFRKELKLLYISPERLAIEGQLEQLKEFGVEFFAIDEAHCLSEWGHDFRPDYLFLSNLKISFPKTPIAAFTATATQKVQDDIITLLQLNNPYITRASFNREELYYQVTPKIDVKRQMLSYIKNHKDEAGIIYRLSRKDVEKTAEFLVKNGVKALPYHAGLSKDIRNKHQEQFNRDEVQVVVATTAFGMGINKSNIRYVLHGDLPKSMEGYYQETGRAGRDGMASNCILFFSRGDISKQQYFIDRIEDVKEQEKSRLNLNHLVRFATINNCRRKQILDYFGENHPNECGNCDICNNVSESVDATIDAQKVLSAIIRTHEGFGINHIIDIVWGADTEKIRAKNHNKLTTFGVGKDKSKKWWRGIITELLGQEVIYQNPDRYNVLTLNESAREILFNKGKFSISETTASQKDEVKVNNKQSILDDNYDMELFNKLRDVRSKLAKEHQVPPYIIFNDKTLKDMSIIKPENHEQFLMVSGVGEKKLEVYGGEFLPVIREYLN